jgi:hypothetical protein
MKKNRIAVRGAVLTACAGLLGGLLACSGDDSTAPVPAPDSGADGSTVADAGDGSTAHDASTSDGSLADGSAADAGSWTDGSTAEASATDGSSTDGSSTDGSKTDGSASDGSSTDGSSTDGSMADGGSDASSSTDSASNEDAATGDVSAADATNPPPPQVDLCPVMQAIWQGVPLKNSDDWPEVILNGPLVDSGGVLGTTGTAGFENLSTCTLGNFPGINLLSSQANAEYTAWDAQCVDWELQIFGCSESDAGISFGLIPANLQGTLLTTTDLAVIGSWWLNSMQQAVLNQGGTLTTAQYNQIEAQVAYSETTYQPQVDSPINDLSTCPTAGTDDGGSD